MATTTLTLKAPRTGAKAEQIAALQALLDQAAYVASQQRTLPPPPAVDQPTPPRAIKQPESIKLSNLKQPLSRPVEQPEFITPANLEQPQSNTKTTDKEPSRAATFKPFKYQEHYDMLLKQFPALRSFQPLAIGIKVKLLEMANGGTLSVPPTTLVAVMSWHCSRTTYLRNLANDGSYRHDMEGNPVEPVSDDHRQFACHQLMDRKQRAKNKKQ